MDIRDPDWKYRYAPIGKMAHPALDAFGLGELEGFDRALKPTKAFPKLEKHVQDFRAHVADPLIGAFLFSLSAAPIAASQAQHTAEFYKKIKSRVARAPRREITQETRTMLARMKEQANLWRSFDAEIKQSYETYEQFVTDDLLAEITRRYDSCRVLTLDNSAPLLRTATVRNEIYRAALKSKERAWLVNWDLAIVAKHHRAMCEDNERQMQLYQEVKNETPELLPKNKRLSIGLAPAFGPLDTSLENMYENLLPSQITVEESTVLQRAVTDYITNRVKEIYA